MSRLARPVLFLTVVLALPLVGAALWAAPLAEWVAAIRADPPGRAEVAGLLVLLLAGDIVLPVPSSPLITLAGAQLGWAWAAAAAWTGLTLGGAITVGAARRWGQPLVERWIGREDLASLRAGCDRHGVWLLLVSRPLPIVAEGVLLTISLAEPRWLRTLGVLAVGNAVVAATFALLGAQAAASEELAIGVTLSIAVPLALAWYVRRVMVSRMKVATGVD